MDRWTFRALAMTGMLLPVGAFSAGLVHPRSRAVVKEFLAPLSYDVPSETHDAGATKRPTASDVLGAESVELRTLREDAGGKATFSRSRLSPLFALAKDGQLVPPDDRHARPAGLRRPEVLSREDPSVDAAVAGLTSDPRSREAFVQALKRSGRSSAEVARIFRAWKLPEAALAVMLVESAAVETTSSDDGGMGLWQLTPDVAHVYGLSMLPSYDERRAVATATEAAAHYLADLRERFGSWELAIAAFGFGYAPTLATVAGRQDTDPAELAAALPKAAKTYLAEVLATAVVLSNLERFGLDAVQRDEPYSLSNVEVPPSTSLRLVARAAGLPYEILREQNPEYEGELVPQAAFPLVVHVPSDRFARTREYLPLVLAGGDALGDAGPAASGSPAAPDRDAPVLSRGVEQRMFHRAKEGDTLASLAKEHGVALEMLASDNALDPTASLRPGTIVAIRLPSSQKTKALSRQP